MSDYDDELERWSNDELLDAVKNGNGRAFVTFCVRELPSLQKYVRYLCRKRGVPLSLAEDFAQEAVLKAVDRIQASMAPRSPTAWLRRIASNAMLDWCRKNKRVSLAEAPILPDTHDIESRRLAEEHEEVLKFLGWLAADSREILEKVCVQEMSVVAAGESMNLSPAASYKKYQRALETLRDMIAEHGSQANAKTSVA